MSHYRIVLSGRVLPGSDHDQAVQSLARLFKIQTHQAAGMLDGRPRPLKRELPLEKAEKIQMKLHRIGVGARVEAVPGPAATTVPKLELEPVEDTPPSVGPPKLCPKCGYEQLGGEVCENCGVVFAKVKADDVDSESQWREDTERKYQPVELLPEFIGPNEDRYMPRFQAFERLGGKFTLTWHWPAVFVPFLWALYRKLWVWAVIIWITSYMVPIGMQLGILSAMSEGRIPSFFLIGGASLLGFVLWLVWPMTVNYLYYRMAMKRLRPIAARYRGDEALDRAADAGGVSSTAVVLGVLINILLMFGFASVMAPRMAQMSQGMVDNLGGQIEAGDGEQRSVFDQDLSPEAQQTMAQLKGLGVMTRIWVIQHGVTSTRLMSRERFDEDLDLKPEDWQDAWKHSIRFETEGQSYVFRSAGEDGRFGTDDDLMLRNSLPSKE